MLVQIPRRLGIIFRVRVVERVPPIGQGQALRHHLLAQVLTGHGASADGALVAVAAYPIVPYGCHPVGGFVVLFRTYPRSGERPALWSDYFLGLVGSLVLRWALTFGSGFRPRPIFFARWLRCLA